MVARRSRSVAHDIRKHRQPALLSCLKVTPVCAGVCACLAMGNLAYGQQGGGQAIEEILITGSRIVRRDLEAPSPILTVDVSAFEQSSAIALETVLNQYPQFNPGATQFTAGQNQPTADTSPGASTLNMRGLGAGRSLVLVDGRRAQPMNAALAVDINTIPSAMIESVEVISGGAAATYGPDALAGVVNFKLRTDFQGIKMNYQTGITDAGDGEESRADVLIGGNFEGGRGNAVFSIGYGGTREAALQENRDFFVEGWKDPGTEANYPRVSFPLWTPDANNLPSQAGGERRVSRFHAPGRKEPATRLSTSTTTAPSFGCPRTPRRPATPDRRHFRTRSAQTGALQETTPRGYVSSPLTRYTALCACALRHRREPPCVRSRQLRGLRRGATPAAVQCACGDHAARDRVVRATGATTLSTLGARPRAVLGRPAEVRVPTSPGASTDCRRAITATAAIPIRPSSWSSSSGVEGEYRERLELRRRIPLTAKPSCSPIWTIRCGPNGIGMSRQKPGFGKNYPDATVPGNHGQSARLLLHDRPAAAGAVGHERPRGRRIAESGVESERRLPHGDHCADYDAEHRQAASRRVQRRRQARSICAQASCGPLSA